MSDSSFFESEVVFREFSANRTHLPPPFPSLSFLFFLHTHSLGFLARRRKLVFLFIRCRSCQTTSRHIQKETNQFNTTGTRDREQTRRRKRKEENLFSQLSFCLLFAALPPKHTCTPLTPPRLHTFRWRKLRIAKPNQRIRFLVLSRRVVQKELKKRGIEENRYHDRILAARRDFTFSEAPTSFSDTRAEHQ